MRLNHRAVGLASSTALFFGEANHGSADRAGAIPWIRISGSSARDSRTGRRLGLAHADAALARSRTGTTNPSGPTLVAEIITDYTLFMFVELIHLDVVEGFSVNEADDVIGAEFAAYSRIVDAPDALLRYRLPIYLFFHAAHQSNYGHWQAVKDLQYGAEQYGSLMMLRARTVGYKELGWLYFLIGRIPIPAPCGL